VSPLFAVVPAAAVFGAAELTARVAVAACSTEAWVAYQGEAEESVADVDGAGTSLMREALTSQAGRARA